MALQEAHSGSTMRNQAGPMRSWSSVGDIKGLGKKERGQWRRNNKRQVRKAFKVVAGGQGLICGGKRHTGRSPQGPSEIDCHLHLGVVAGLTGGDADNLRGEPALIPLTMHP